MTIIELLASDEYQTRISCGGDRWLCAARGMENKDGRYGLNDLVFTVYEHKRYAKSTKTIIETLDEEEAVCALIES